MPTHAFCEDCPLVKDAPDSLSFTGYPSADKHLHLASALAEIKQEIPFRISTGGARDAIKAASFDCEAPDSERRLLLFKSIKCGAVGLAIHRVTEEQQQSVLR